MKYTSKKNYSVSPSFLQSTLDLYIEYTHLFFLHNVSHLQCPPPAPPPAHCRDRCRINTLWMCSRLVHRDPAPTALLGFRWAHFSHTLSVTEASCRPSSATHRLLLCCIFGPVPLLRCTEMRKKKKKREKTSKNQVQLKSYLLSRLGAKIIFTDLFLSQTNIRQALLRFHY